MAASDLGSRRPSIQRWLMLAFAAVISSFLATAAYSQYWVARIDDPATAIATNAGPSIESLAAARADLSEIQVRIFSQLRMLDEGKPFDFAAVDSAERSLDADVQSYLAQPVFPGETAYAERIRSTVAVLDRVLARVESAVRAGDLVTARHIATTELRDAVELTGNALHETTRFNAQNAAVLALSIERVRQTSTSITVVLNTACAIAAIAAALVVWRVVREYREVVESHNALLARRADELDAFAGRVAHDLLNPMNAIRMSLQLIARAEDKSAERPLVDRAIGAVDRATHVVRDLLDFAKAGAFPEHGGHASLRDAVVEVVDELSGEAREAGVTLHADGVPDCTLVCTKGVLVSILSNLARNAIKYIGDGPRREVTIRAREDDAHVTIEVADTGPGIPDELRERIFLPHVRGPAAGRAGLGLGLATVKRLTEAHGGSVHVTSGAGGGSVFAIDIPRDTSA